MMKEDGSVVPLSFLWQNTWHDISKVTEIRKVASTKGGGKGTRYACKIGDKIHYLFLDGYLWWIELS